MANIGNDLRDAVVARLNAAECITRLVPAVEVLGFDPGSSADIIKRRLTSPGMSVIVVPPDAVASGESDRNRLELAFVVVVGERSTTNRGPSGTRTSAYDLAWDIAAVLMGYQPSAAWRPLDFRGLEQSQAVDPESRDLLVTEVRFATEIRITVGDSGDETAS